MRYAVVFGIIGSMILSSCSDTPPKLRDLYDPYAGPEEFAISPTLNWKCPKIWQAYQHQPQVVIT
jgi:hypothetical protein